MNSVTRCQSVSRLITQASRLVSHSAIQSVRQSVGQLVGLPVSRSFGRLRHHRGRSPMAVFLTASRFRQAKHIHVYLYATKALPSRSAHIHAHQQSSHTHARALAAPPLRPTRGPWKQIRSEVVGGGKQSTLPLLQRVSHSNFK